MMCFFIYAVDCGGNKVKYWHAYKLNDLLWSRTLTISPDWCPWKSSRFSSIKDHQWVEIDLIEAQVQIALGTFPSLDFFCPNRIQRVWTLTE